MAITKPFGPANHVKAAQGEVAISKAYGAEGPQRFILPMQVGGPLGRNGVLPVGLSWAGWPTLTSL